MTVVANFINGEFVEPASGLHFDDVDPATGEACGQVPDSDDRDVHRAVVAAKNAFPGWSETPAAERSQTLLRIADLIEDNLDELARLESIDTGKPLGVARSVDIPRAVENFRFFATAILHTKTEAHQTDTRALNVTLRRPRGVAGLISPWNLPLYLFSWKVAPALATGNTVVGKPSELTPLTAHRLAALGTEAGLPPGVLNIVHGRGEMAGKALVSHPDVPTISFTGGTDTGGRIARAAGPLFKRLALECGGKNPTIVFADADLDEALPAAVRAAFSNQGEICLCGSRILVESPIYELAKVESYVELARREGGTIHCGGTRPPDVGDRCRGGYFLAPAVITGLDASCRTNREEIFGPVVTVMPFEHEQDSVELANATPYGLSASVWTRDLDRGHRVVRRLDCGTVWVNCWLMRDLRVPFGGMKQSGLGREGGAEALRFFTEPKNVCINLRG
jgi:aminomuconate-semialdehyde/2-hydroxymuconate-6-semialdehyde dehydrogenase